MSGTDGAWPAHEELKRLWGLGVRTFQIDPDFDGVFFDAEPGDHPSP